MLVDSEEDTFSAVALVEDSADVVEDEANVVVTMVVSTVVVSSF